MIFGPSTYTIAVSLTQYSDESSLQSAIYGMPSSLGNQANTEKGLEGIIKVFNNTDQRSGSNRAAFIIVNSGWTNPSQV